MSRPLHLLLLLMGGAVAVNIDDLVYQTLPADAACVRLLTRTGQVGCAVADGRGVLADADDVLLGRVTFDPTYPLSILLPYSALTKATIDALKGRYRLAGIFVHSLSKATPSDFRSPAETSPYSYLSPTGRPHPWNANATGLDGLEFDFAVVAVRDSDLPVLQQRVEQNRQRIQSGKDARHQAQFSYPMNAAGDSVRCLKSGNCLPIGGYSVWTSHGGGSRNSTDPIVAAVAQLDASAFVHALAVGANSAMSGLLALLGASDAVAKVADAELNRRIVFAAFNAEFYDLIGSRSFVKDVSSFRCGSVSPDTATQCLSPYRADMTFTSLSGLIQSGSSVVEIAQVGAPLSDPLYFHTRSTALAAAVNAAAAGLPIGVRAATDVEVIGLPPSSSWAFPAAVDKLVLTGYDAQFTSSVYGSELDVSLSDTAIQVQRTSTDAVVLETPRNRERIVSATAVGDSFFIASVVHAGRFHSTFFWILFSELPSHPRMTTFRLCDSIRS